MKLRNLAAGLALLVTGTIVGVTSQQLASADVSSGDRPVLVPIESCRLIDTRPAFNVGPRTSPLGPTETLTLDTQQTDTECTGNIPTSATALAINLTALNATANGFITLWAEGARPNGSTLNPAPGQLVVNAATVELANDNAFRIYNENGSVDIIIDIVGYYENHNHDDRYYTETEIDSSKSQSITIGPSAFHSRNTFSQRQLGSGGQLAARSGNGPFIAPLVLPDGTTIDEVTAYLWDDVVGSRLEVGFWQVGLTSGYSSQARLTTSTTDAIPGTQELSTSTIALNTIDTSSFHYEIWVSSFDGAQWETLGFDLRFEGIRIDYTLP